MDLEASAVFLKSTLFCWHSFPSMLMWYHLAFSYSVIVSLSHFFLHVVSPAQLPLEVKVERIWLSDCSRVCVLKVFFIFLGVFNFSKSVMVSRKVFVLLEISISVSDWKPFADVFQWSSIVTLAFHKWFFIPFTTDSTFPLTLLLYGLTGIYMFNSSPWETLATIWNFFSC